MKHCFNLKPVISLCIALMLAMSSVIPAFASDGNISAEDRYAAPGDTVSLPVIIDRNPGIAGLALSVSYGEELTLLSVEDGGILGEYLHGNDLSANPYKLTWNNMCDITGTGVLATLIFKVSEKTVNGSTLPVNITLDETVYNINEELLDYSVYDGSIHVAYTEPGALKGDVNGDGESDVSDSVLLAQYLAAWSVTVDAMQSDCNGDGHIDCKDAVLLEQYLAGWNVSFE